MRIAIDASRAILPYPTGTERYAFEIIRHLLELPAAQDHEWHLYLPQTLPATSPLLATHVEVVQHYLPPARMWTHRRLAPALAHAKPDLLFVPAHVLPFTPPGLLPPSVVTVHDLGFVRWPEAHTRSQRTYLNLTTRYAVRRAAGLIAVSHATAHDLAAWYGADPARVHVIYEAARPALASIPALDRDARARYGLRRPYAFFIGTLQPRKNLLLVAHAFARLRAAGHTDFDLVLAGAPGWKSEPLLAAMGGLGLGDTLHLPGYLPANDAAALLRGALFFCYPSLHEGFGLPVLEAQQEGIAVLTSNNSSLPEVAGEGALLVDPTDVDAIAAAMLNLSRDEALRQRLIAAGYANVKRFSWQKAAAETLAVLTTAAQAGKRR